LRIFIEWDWRPILAIATKEVAGVGEWLAKKRKATTTDRGRVRNE